MSYLIELVNMTIDPLLVLVQFGGQETSHGGGHFLRSRGIEQQHANAAREHILHGTGHFLTGSQDDLRLHVGIYYVA